MPDGGQRGQELTSSPYPWPRPVAAGKAVTELSLEARYSGSG